MSGHDHYPDRFAEYGDLHFEGMLHEKLSSWIQEKTEKHEQDFIEFALLTIAWCLIDQTIERNL